MTKNIFTLIGLGFGIILYAQIDSETIDVEKSYNPTISDGNKIEENPNFDNEIDKNKISIQYTPINTPVESDYKVSSINPIKLPTIDNDPIYSSFVKAGIGIPSTYIGEAYLDYEYTPDKHFGVFAHHYFNTEAIDQVKVDDDHTQSHLELFYKGNYDKMSAHITAGYDISHYNYYGIGNLETVFGNNSANTIYQTIDPENTYHTTYINLGFSSYEDTIFDNANGLLRNFNGGLNAQELYAALNGKFILLNFNDYSPAIKIDFEGWAKVEFVNSDFDQFNFDSRSIYNYLKLDLTPVLKFTKEDYYLKLGATISRNIDFKDYYNDFHFYPMAELMITPIDQFQIFAGIKGGLKNNTYYDWVQNNPWMAPGIALLPTHTPYDLYGGIKGVFNDVFQYKTELSYKKVENFPMMKSIPIQQSLPISIYRLENAFGLVYDEVKNINIIGELNYVGIEQLTATAKIGIHHYDTHAQYTAWNYPNLTATLSGVYKLLENKLQLGTDIYYVGSRKDITYDYTTGVAIENKYKTLNNYFDLNCSGTYYFNERWSAFAHLNNLLGNYDKYKNYLSQAQQIMIGAVYKFNINR